VEAQTVSAGSTEAFAHAMLGRDFEAMTDLLTADVTVTSPITSRFRFQGTEDVVGLLREVRAVLDDLEYVDRFGDEEVATMRFRATIGGREIEGVDIVRFDAEQRIAEMTVFVRPLPGIAALAAALAPRLAHRRGRLRAMIAKVAVGPLVLFNRFGDWLGVRLVGR
jgi:hypothetical protein